MAMPTPKGDNLRPENGLAYQQSEAFNIDKRTESKTRSMRAKRPSTLQPRSGPGKGATRKASRQKAKPLVPIGNRQANILKLVPRLVVERIILKWSKFRIGLNETEMVESLPFGQNIGDYLARASNPDTEMPTTFKQLYMHDSTITDTVGLVTPDKNQSQVVVIAIKLHAIYEVIDFQIAKRQVDESQIIEQFARLTDEFVRIVSDSIYGSASVQEGDIIQFFGDSIVICLPGEEYRPDKMDGASVSAESKAKKKSKKERKAEEETQKQNQDTRSFRNQKHALETAQRLYFRLTKTLQKYSESDGITGEVIIGMGYGNCVMYHAGGVFNRTVNFAVGEALNQAQDSLRLAASNSGIVVSRALWERFTYFAGLVAEADEDFEGIGEFDANQVHHAGFRQITSDMEAIQRKLKEETEGKRKNHYYFLLRRELDVTSRRQKEHIWRELENYIPKYFRNFLDSNKKEQDVIWKQGLKQGNSQSQITIMALTLELDGAFESHDSLLVLQTTIEIIQKQIYKMGGSLSKVYYDGSQDHHEHADGRAGGLQIIAEWGLHSINYHDNCARACIAALNIQRAVREFILLHTLHLNSMDNSSEDEQVNAMLGDPERVSQARESRISRRRSKVFSVRKRRKMDATGVDTIIKDEEEEEFDLPIHIGIATGDVFLAIVGDETSRSERLEIGLIGDAYNRSHALLSYAMKEYGKIYIDYLTMTQAKAQLDIQYCKHIELRDKFFNIPIFEPRVTEPLDQFVDMNKTNQVNVKHLFKQFEQDFIKQGSLIKIHHNPMILDYNNSYQTLNNKIYGQTQQAKDVIRHITQRLQDRGGLPAVRLQNQDTVSSHMLFEGSSQLALEPTNGSKPFSVLVMGVRGQGKSLFARNILINLKQLELLVAQQVKQFEQFRSAGSKNIGHMPLQAMANNSLYDFQASPNQYLKFRFCVSQCTPDTALQFLGVWRPVLRTLLNHISSIYDKKPYKILMQIIEEHPQRSANKLQFLVDYFHLGELDPVFTKKMAVAYPQLEHQKRTKFYEPTRYGSRFEEDVLQFFVQLITECLEKIIQWQATTQDKGFTISTMVAFIIDNAQCMQEVDWKLHYELITQSSPCFKNLVVITNVERTEQYIKPLWSQTNSTLGLVLHEKATRFYVKHYKTRELELFSKIVDLQPLSAASINQMLLDQSEVYLKQHLDEVEKMVEQHEGSLKPSNYLEQMLDDSNPNIIKSKGHEELFRRQLSGKFQVFSQFRKIDKEVIEHVTKMSNGTPLVAFSYFHALLTKGFLEVRQDSVTMTKKLKASLEFDHFQGQFHVPYDIQNCQSVYLDQKLENIHKQTQAPLAVVVCLYTLRVSSMIGHTFSNSMLTGSGLCPHEFKVGLVNYMPLNRVLDILEEHDFIELIDELGDERKYRFNHRLSTNTISQTMPFLGFKRRVHTALAEYQKNCHPTVEKDSDEIVHRLKRQLLLQNQQQFRDKLRPEIQEQILKKEIDLQIDVLKIGAQRLQIVTKNLLETKLSVSSRELDVYKEAALQQTTRRDKKSKRKKKNVVEVPTTQYHEQVHLILHAEQQQIQKQQASHKPQSQQFSLVILEDPQKVKKPILNSETDSDSDEEAKTQKKRALTSPVIRIKIEDIVKLTPIRVSNEIPTTAKEAEPSDKKTRSKKQRDKVTESPLNTIIDPELAHPTSETSQQRALLEVHYNNYSNPQDPRLEVIGLRFSQEEQRQNSTEIPLSAEQYRQKWLTYINVLREKLQIQAFILRYGPLQIQQYGGTLQTAARPRPVATRLGRGVKETRDFNERVARQVQQASEENARTQGNGTSMMSLNDIRRGVSIMHQTRLSLGSDSGNSVVIADKHREEKVELLKRQLKCMYSIGMAHLTDCVQRTVFTPQQAKINFIPQVCVEIIEREAEDLGLRMHEEEIQEETVQELLSGQEEPEDQESHVLSEDDAFGEGESYDESEESESEDAAQEQYTDSGSAGEFYLEEEAEDHEPASEQRRPSVRVEEAPESHESEPAPAQGQLPVGDAAPRVRRTATASFELADDYIFAHQDQFAHIPARRTERADPGQLELLQNFENTQNIAYEETRVSFLRSALPFASERAGLRYFVEGFAIDRFNKDGFVNGAYDTYREGLSSSQQTDWGHSPGAPEHLQTEEGISQSQTYTLRCQRAKKVFTDQEIEQLRLRRRHMTTKVKFSIYKVLGMHVPDQNGVEEGDELDSEMQHLLAGVITKILNQKSVRESVANLHTLVVDELQDVVREEQRRTPHAQNRNSVAQRASQRLLETFQNQQQPEKQNELLQRSLSRTLSKRGLAGVSEQGLRSTALLQNYIEQNLSLDRRASQPSSVPKLIRLKSVPNNAQLVSSYHDGGGESRSSQRYLNDQMSDQSGGGDPQAHAKMLMQGVAESAMKTKMQSLSRALAGSESRSSLRQPHAHTIQTLEQSIESIRNRDLLAHADGYPHTRGHTPQAAAERSARPRSPLTAGDHREWANKSSSHDYGADQEVIRSSNTLTLQLRNERTPRAGAPPIRVPSQSLHSQVQSQYSRPIIEQEQEHSDLDSGEELIGNTLGTQQEVPTMKHDDYRTGQSQQDSLMESIQSLVEKKEQEFLLEQTFNREHLLESQTDLEYEQLGDTVQHAIGETRQGLTQDLRTQQPQYPGQVVGQSKVRASPILKGESRAAGRRQTQPGPTTPVDQHENSIYIDEQVPASALLPTPPLGAPGYGVAWEAPAQDWLTYPSEQQEDDPGQYQSAAFAAPDEHEYASANRYDYQKSQEGQYTYQPSSYNQYNPDNYLSGFQPVDGHRQYEAQYPEEEKKQEDGPLAELEARSAGSIRTLNGSNQGKSLNQSLGSHSSLTKAQMRKKLRQQEMPDSLKGFRNASNALKMTQSVESDLNYSKDTSKSKRLLRKLAKERQGVDGQIQD